MAAVAVLLYAFAAVLQTAGARRAARRSTTRLRVVDLLREATWLIGVLLLVLAFLAFVLSTRVLPLPVAEVIRSFYPVLTVLLEHVAFRSRVHAGELVGAAFVLVGPAVLAASGGTRGDEQAGTATSVTMALVLAAVTLLSAVAGRGHDRPDLRGLAQAGLSGVAFAVVDIGVRAIPSPFSPLAALTTTACWVGAVSAPVGLLLFSRAVTTTSAGRATVVLTVVNVVVASAWSVVAFGDRSDAGSGQYAVALTTATLGLWLMARTARGDVMSRTPH